MTYEKKTGAINLEELEIQADELNIVSAAGNCTVPGKMKPCRTDEFN